MCTGHDMSRTHLVILTPSAAVLAAGVIHRSDLKHSLKEAHGENTPVLSSEFTPPPHTQLVSNSITSYTQVTAAATGRRCDVWRFCTVCQLEMLGFMCQNHGQVLVHYLTHLIFNIYIYIYTHIAQLLLFLFQYMFKVWTIHHLKLSIQQHGKFDISRKLCRQCYRKQLQSSFYQTSAVL